MTTDQPQEPEGPLDPPAPPNVAEFVAEEPATEPVHNGAEGVDDGLTPVDDDDDEDDEDEDDAPT
jgi:hypothetical protein